MTERSRWWQRLILFARAQGPAERGMRQRSRMGAAEQIDPDQAGPRRQIEGIPSYGDVPASETANTLLGDPDLSRKLASEIAFTNGRQSAESLDRLLQTFETYVQLTDVKSAIEYAVEDIQYAKASKLVDAVHERGAYDAILELVRKVTETRPDMRNAFDIDQMAEAFGKSASHNGERQAALNTLASVQKMVHPNRNRTTGYYGPLEPLLNTYQHRETTSAAIVVQEISRDHDRLQAELFHYTDAKYPSQAEQFICRSLDKGYEATVREAAAARYEEDVAFLTRIGTKVGSYALEIMNKFRRARELPMFNVNKEETTFDYMLRNSPDDYGRAARSVLDNVARDAQKDGAALRAAEEVFSLISENGLSMMSARQAIHLIGRKYQLLHEVPVSYASTPPVFAPPPLVPRETGRGPSIGQDMSRPTGGGAPHSESSFGESPRLDWPLGPHASTISPSVSAASADRLLSRRTGTVNFSLPDVTRQRAAGGMVSPAASVNRPVPASQSLSVRQAPEPRSRVRGPIGR